MACVTRFLCMYTVMHTRMIGLHLFKLDGWISRIDFQTGTRCLKIKEKVAFNIASEASYVYILNGQISKMPILRVFENLKPTFKQCYQTGQFY